MLREIFDEIDENELIDDLEGYEEYELDQLEDEEEDPITEESNKSRRKSLSFADYDEELDAEEKRRLMSIGMDLP